MKINKDSWLDAEKKLETDKPRAREFWLTSIPRKRDDADDFEYGQIYYSPRKESIHVIEISALKATEQRCKEFEACEFAWEQTRRKNQWLEQRLEEACAALEQAKSDRDQLLSTSKPLIEVVRAAKVTAECVQVTFTDPTYLTDLKMAIHKYESAIDAILRSKK